jgi:hypothetical protein
LVNGHGEARERARALAEGRPRRSRCTPDRRAPPRDRRRARHRLVPRPRRINEHEDPAPHPHRVRVPWTRTTRRARDARPRLPPTPSPRPRLTHGNNRRASYVRVIRRRKAPRARVRERARSNPLCVKRSSSLACGRARLAPWRDGAVGRSVLSGPGSDLTEEPALRDVEPVTLALESFPWHCCIEPARHVPVWGGVRNGGFAPTEIGRSV